MTPQRPVVVGVLLYLGRRTMSDQSNQLRIEVRDDVRLSAIRECDKAAFVTFLNDRDRCCAVDQLPGSALRYRG